MSNIHPLGTQSYIFHLKRTWGQDIHNRIQPENAIFNISYESASIPLNCNNSKNIMTLQKPICNRSEMTLFMTFFIINKILLVRAIAKRTGRNNLFLIKTYSC